MRYYHFPIKTQRFRVDRSTPTPLCMGRRRRQSVLVEFLRSRGGRVWITPGTLQELYRRGLTRSRSEQTIEELADAGVLTVREMGRVHVELINGGRMPNG